MDTVINFKLEEYKKKLEERAEKTSQPTYNQMLALELAQEFNDMKHKGYYFRICKQYPTHCIVSVRDKVRNAQARSPGALFTTLFNKYIIQDGKQNKQSAAYNPTH